MDAESPHSVASSTSTSTVPNPTGANGPSPPRSDGGMPVNGAGNAVLDALGIYGVAVDGVGGATSTWTSLGARSSSITFDMFQDETFGFDSSSSRRSSLRGWRRVLSLSSLSSVHLFSSAHDTAAGATPPPYVAPPGSPSLSARRPSSSVILARNALSGVLTPALANAVGAGVTPADRRSSTWSRGPLSDETNVANMHTQRPCDEAMQTRRPTLAGDTALARRPTLRRDKVYEPVAGTRRASPSVSVPCVSR